MADFDFNSFLEEDKRRREELNTDSYDQAMLETLERESAKTEKQKKSEGLLEFLKQDQAQNSPHIYDTQAADDVLRTSPDPDKQLQMMHNAEILDKWVGFQPGFSYENYEEIFSTVAGDADPLSNSQYLKSKFESGQKMIELNKMFYQYMYNPDPDTAEEIDKLYEGMPYIPGSYGKVLEALGMAAENAPQMAEGLKRGSVVGGASFLGVAGLAMGLGIPFAGLATGVTLASTGTTALSMGGAAFGVGMLAAQGRFSYEQMAGGFANMVYSELKASGVEKPDLGNIALIASSVGAVSSVFETASASSILSTIPGLDKYFNKIISKKLGDYLTKTVRTKASKVLKGAAGRGISAGLGSMTQVATVAGENAVEEVFQEITSETGRLIYKTARNADTMSRSMARDELLATGVIPTVNMIDDYITGHSKGKLPDRSAKELVNQYYEAAYSGAIIGGLYSVPGSSLGALQKGTAEYSATKVHIDQVLHDIIAEADGPADVRSRILENKELQRIINPKAAKVLANEFYDNRALQEMERSIYDRMWESPDEGISKGSDGNYYNSDGQLVDIVFEDPDGLYYDEAGKAVQELPEQSKIKKFELTEEGLFLDEDGDSWLVPPWDERRFRKELITGKDRPFVVHKDPDTGTYFDEEGNSYEYPPRGALAKEWVKYEDGYSYDAEGNKALGKPWEMGIDTRVTYNPRTGAKRGPAIKLKAEATHIRQPGNLYITEPEAKARYLKAVEEARVDNKPLDIDYKEWVSQQKYVLVEDKARRYAIDAEADIRHYRHVIDYAQNFTDRLSEEQKDIMQPAIDKLQKHITDLDAGRKETFSFADAIAETHDMVYKMHQEIVKLRLVEKNSKTDKVKRKAHNNIMELRDNIEEAVAENKMFEKFVEKTQYSMMSYYYQLHEQTEYVKRMADMLQKHDDPEQQKMFNGTLLLEELYETHKIEGDKGKETLFGGFSVQKGTHDLLGVSDRLLRRIIKEATVGGKQEMMSQGRIKRSERGNKDRVRRYISETIGQIMKEVPRTTVHFEEATSIESIQNLIDPKWRSAKTLEEYDKAISNIRKSRGDHTYVEDALAALKKPLNKMTIDEVKAIHYSVEMLKDIGRVKKDMARFREDSKISGLRDMAIDSAGGITAQSLKDAYWTEQYKGLSGKGKKKAVLGLYSKYLVPEMVFDSLDGFQNYEGPMVEFFVDERNRAHAQKLKNVGERRGKIDAWIKENDYKRGRLFKKIQVFNKSFEVQEVMTMYGAYGKEGKHSGNQHMADVLNERMGIGPELASMAIERLTDKDILFADQIMGDYADDFSRLNEIYQQRTNQSLIKEENYTPIVFDFFEHLDSASADDMIYAEMMDRGRFDEKKVSDNFVKKRVEVINNEMADKPRTVRMGMFEVWTEMVQKREHYINMGDLARQMKKVISDKDFVTAIKSKLGSSWYDTISSYVDAQVSPYGWKGFSVYDKILRGLKHGGTISFLAGNMGTVLKQLPSTAFYIKYAGIEHWSAAAAKMIANPFKFFEDIRARDPLFKNRGFALENLDWRKEYGRKSVSRASGKYGMMPIQMMDHLTVAIGSEATYRKALDSGKSEKEALDYTRKVTNISQPNADPGALPAVWRTNEAIRFSLIFSQQITKIFDMLTYETVSNLSNKDYGAAVYNIMAIQLSTLAIAIVSQKRLPETPEEWLETMVNGNLTYIPHIGRMITSASKGFSPNNILQDVVEDSVKAAKAWNDDKASIENTFDVLRTNLPTFGVITGLPGNTTSNIIDAFEEQSAWELIGGPPRESEKPPW